MLTHRYHLFSIRQCGLIGMEAPYIELKITDATPDTVSAGKGPASVERDMAAMEQEAVSAELNAAPVETQLGLSERESAAAEAEPEMGTVEVEVELASVEIESPSVCGDSDAGIGSPRPTSGMLDPTTFELEIPREWRFSRTTYPGRGPISWNDEDQPQEEVYGDPMDEDRFDEATAFPLQKPNIEVFGLSPPSTLRRQRGWYQRKRWLPPEGQGFDHGAELATGADVLPNVFDLVLGRLWDARCRYRPKDKIPTSKRELGLIALVCRRWAELVQPVMFEWINLYSFADFIALGNFLQHSTTAVSRHLRNVQLCWNLTQYPHVPWIHTACLSKALNKYSIVLNIQGPLLSDHVLTGFHEMLPRSAPSFCSRIEVLRITNVHFKSLIHLVRAIGDMPDLKYVELEEVTWDFTLDNEPRPPPTRRARFRVRPHYAMKGCTDDAAIVWFRFLLRCPGAEQLEQVELDRLYRIVSILASSGECGRMTCPGVGDESTDTYMHVTLPQACFVFYNEEDHRLFDIHILFTQYRDGHAEHIRFIEFAADNLQRGLPVDCAWAEIGDLIEDIPSLKTLSFISFADESKSDIMFFHNEIVRRKMYSFCNSSKLQYWHRADSVADNAQPVQFNSEDLGIYKLEIPREWRFSRISYPGRGPVWWNGKGELGKERYEDPMDDEKFNEATAFPLLKPNIEVFGLSPPATLRRQRGWYQRKRWPPLKGKAVDREEKSATGEDVPPELFDIVLGWLVDGRLPNARKGRVGASKRELGSMALVCRRWAKLIQPIIFKWINLKNREDVDTVRKSLQSPTNAMSEHLQYPQLNLRVTTYPYIPWIHTACSPNTFAKQSIGLDITGPLPFGRSMKGLHDMLPRSGPWFCSRITALRLTNVHFKSLLHLMRAIGDIPDLMFARLEKVTWDCPSDDELHPPLARRARFRVHPRYIMEGCTDDAAVMWFRLLLQFPGSDRLADADADRLYRIVSALSKHGEYKRLMCLEVGWEGIDVGVLFLFGDENDYWLFCVHVTFTPAVEGHAVDIKTVAIEAASFQRMLSADALWKEIDDIAGHLSSLKTFHFLSWVGSIHSQEDILYVHSEIVVKKMPNLQSSSKVRYAIQLESGPSDKWVWTRADISSEENEPKCKLIGPRIAGEYGWIKFL
ncbi:hypothetical protein NM688_g2670 [Phlebia brevispora]|uniref:Uncharacterized protein n=1 Tax=Phlebia brevispora TaxID=194682 RepID=A0ACC1T7U6_9APHY|nr:hypothetical protein NM688_g2670 [Phlebia brevispora]